jgi:hypothetical protein
MEKWLVIAVALGVGLASASGVLAGYQLLKSAEPRPIVRSAPASAPTAAQPEAGENCASATVAEALARHDAQDRLQEKRANERGC